MTNNNYFEKVLDFPLIRDFKEHYRSLIVSNTRYYQKKYGFQMNSMKGHDTWNVEADGFKHTFGSAYLALKLNPTISNYLGTKHETSGSDNPNNEKNMDLNNNKVGRQVALEIKSECKNWNKLSQRELNDLIAAKVWQKMNEGKVILTPSGRTKLLNPPSPSVYKEQMKVISKYKDSKKSSPTGFATNIDESLLNLENRVFYDKEINPNQTNDKEVLDKVIGQYFDNGKRIPSKEELNQQVASGDLIYVQDYSRSDGTKVSGYYRTHKNK